MRNKINQGHRIRSLAGGGGGGGGGAGGPILASGLFKWQAAFLSARKKKVQSRRNSSRSCLQLNIRGFSKFCTS